VAPILLELPWRSDRPRSRSASAATVRPWPTNGGHLGASRRAGGSAHRREALTVRARAPHPRRAEDEPQSRRGDHHPTVHGMAVNPGNGSPSPPSSFLRRSDRAYYSHPGTPRRSGAGRSRCTECRFAHEVPPPSSRLRPDTSRPEPGLGAHTRRQPNRI
jgi:hypothetical protein